MFADDVTIIGVAGRDDADTYAEWVTARGVDGFDHIADPNGEVWSEFGVVIQPAFTFINDDGTIETRLGAMGTQGLTDRINELIAA